MSMMKKWCAGALLLSVNLAAFGAICETSATHFGTLSESKPVWFGASCAADPDGDPNDPLTWSFVHTYTFTLAGLANVNSYIDLNFTPAREVDPRAEWGGEPHFMISADFITFEHDGVLQQVGGGGHGYNEYSRIIAHQLEAGEYTMKLHGQVFNYRTRSGFYLGDLNVDYLDPPIAAPVPEPETLALMMLGAPVVAWGVRRRKRLAAQA